MCVCACSQETESGHLLCDSGRECGLVPGRLETESLALLAQHGHGHHNSGGAYNPAYNPAHNNADNIGVSIDLYVNKKTGYALGMTVHGIRSRGDFVEKHPSSNLWRAPLESPKADAPGWPVW